MPHAVALAGQEAEPVAVGAFGERDAALTGGCAVLLVEEADLHAVGVVGEDAELGAALDERQSGRRREVPQRSRGRRGSHGLKRRGPLRWPHE